MTESVKIPLWLLLIICAFAAWTFIDRLIIPGIKLFFRKRLTLFINELNKHLDLELPEFKLIKRRILIDRLVYDPQVLETAKKYSQEQGISDKAAMENVKHYAREIVPSFNAFIYFRPLSWLNKSLSRLLYRVRIGFADEQGLKKVGRQSSVVFIMNHRSNMDYILLAYLAIKRVALSFAAGEWARVWPVKPLARSMGAFFVRRGSENPLYRCILARYVQMATEAGVVQVAYVEGKLPKDGKLCKPRIGLLDYMLRSFDPEGKRDLVFIPVGINYDRVLEDRTLLLGADPEAKKKSLASAIRITLFFIIRNLWLMARRGWHRFGYAVVNFGTPVSMRQYLKSHRIDFRKMSKETRIKKVQSLASDLMDEVAKLIPVIPVSLVSHVFAENQDKNLSQIEVKAEVQSLVDRLEKNGAHVYIPRSDRDYAVEVGLRMLTLRHLVLEENNLFRASPQEIKLLSFYANSIAHLVRPEKTMILRV